MSIVRLHYGLEPKDPHGQNLDLCPAVALKAVLFHLK